MSTTNRHNQRKLRGNDHYSIGLDIGVASVGWAAVDTLSGELLTFNHKPTWGSRLFDEAKPASDTRLKRGMRRRIQRRRWRINILQQLFAEEIAKVDPQFFMRLKASRLHPKDRQEWFSLSNRTPLFPTRREEERYYEAFPTIYHLRKYLLSATEKVDIRLIYLAFHNIVKVRGNFLYQDQPSLSAQNANMDTSIEMFYEAFNAYLDLRGIENLLKPEALEALKGIFKENTRARDIQSDITQKADLLFNVKPQKTERDLLKNLTSTALGYTSKFAKDFDIEGFSGEFKLNDDAKKADFERTCPEEARDVYEALKAIYNSYVLTKIILGSKKGCSGKTISYYKVEEFETYKSDLHDLKDLFREYLTADTYALYFGPVWDYEYEKSRISEDVLALYFDKDGNKPKDARFDGKHPACKQIKGYKHYNHNHGYASEALFKETKTLFENSAYFKQADSFDEEVKRLQEDKRFKRLFLTPDANEHFLRRLKTADNGVIPYQLHLEEMRSIIESQKQYYPFLADAEGTPDGDYKLAHIVKFRRPYYVGPLQQEKAPKDAAGNTRFSWTHRKEGMEGVPLRPWNLEDLIDKDKAAESFIRRMTGKCRYLKSKDVLPATSLTYQYFNVLQELNNASYRMADGDTIRTFTPELIHILVEGLFKKRKTVSFKTVYGYMKQHSSDLGNRIVEIRGTSDKSKFLSTMSSWVDFQEILGIDDLGKIGDPLYDTIEEIIADCTVFEDQKILKKRLEERINPVTNEPLTKEQVKKILNKRNNFTGWGNLSQEFLTEIRYCDAYGITHSILEMLEQGDPERASRKNNLETLLDNEALGLRKRIAEVNKQEANACNLTVQDLYGSPALKRSVNQTLKIIREIVGIAGHAPDYIFIEEARKEELDNKKRTTKRADAIYEGLENLRNENEALYASLINDFDKEKGGINQGNDALYLYFAQGGKCFYSGKRLEIGNLASYQIDHIIPQSYTKDDSLENRVLVLPSENQRKKDNKLLDPKIQNRMRGHWYAMYKAGLIGDKKLRNLMKTEFKEEELERFVQRQLVQTRQIIKDVKKLIEVEPCLHKDGENTPVVFPVKAGISSELREKTDLHKSRLVNDYHHAHDAFLATLVGRYLSLAHSDWLEDPKIAARDLKKQVRDSQTKSREFWNTLTHNHPETTYPELSEEQQKAFRDFKKQQASDYTGGASFIVKELLHTTVKPGKGSCSVVVDPHTGEILSESTKSFEWYGEKEIAYARRAFDFPSVYISRKAHEDSGAFWLETLFSNVRPNKKPNLPLKSNLDISKYGGYSGEEYAYFYVYRALDKKERETLVLAPVPLPAAAHIKNKQETLEKFACRQAAEAGMTFVKVERKSVLKNQVVEFGGSRYLIRGLKAIHNEKEPFLRQESMKILVKLFDASSNQHQSLTDTEAVILWNSIGEAVQKIDTYHSYSLDYKTKLSQFVALETTLKQKVVQELLSLVNGKEESVDLTGINLPQHYGRHSATWTKIFKEASNTGGVTFIDLSVTGMHETRQTIKL